MSNFIKIKYKGSQRLLDRDRIIQVYLYPEEFKHPFMVFIGALSIPDELNTFQFDTFKEAEKFFNNLEKQLNG